MLSAQRAGEGQDSGITLSSTVFDNVMPPTHTCKQSLHLDLSNSDCYIDWLQIQFVNFSGN